MAGRPRCWCVRLFGIRYARRLEHARGTGHMAASALCPRNVQIRGVDDAEEETGEALGREEQDGKEGEIGE